MFAPSEPVNVRLLRGPARGPQSTYFGMLLDRPRAGARMTLLLAPRGRMITSRVIRTLETEPGRIYVQTENSLYVVQPLAPGLPRPVGTGLAAV